MKDAVLANFMFNHQYLHMLVDELTDEQFIQMQPGWPNHPAWQIGHITLTLVGQQKLIDPSVEADEELSKLFGMNTEPATEAGIYLSKSELLARLDAEQSKSADLFQKIDPERFNDATDHPFLSRIMPTLGQALTFLMVTHYGVHTGQLSAWRRSAELPRVV